MDAPRLQGRAHARQVLVRHEQGGHFHFVLKAESGEIVATSETYTTKRRCLEGIESVKRLAADAPVEDQAPDS